MIGGYAVPNFVEGNIVDYVDNSRTFGFEAGFRTIQERDVVYNLIPKSYGIHKNTYNNYPKMCFIITAIISLVPNEVTGKVNEAGIKRINKIKEKVFPLLRRTHRFVNQSNLEWTPNGIRIIRWDD